MASSQLTLAGLVVRPWMGSCQGDQTCCDELGDLHGGIEGTESWNALDGGVWALALYLPQIY